MKVIKLYYWLISNIREFDKITTRPIVLSLTTSIFRCVPSKGHSYRNTTSFPLHNYL